jgi:hypothetical protein
VTYRLIAITALVCIPAMAQAPPRGLEGSASSEPGTAERQVLGGSALAPVTGQPRDVTMEQVSAPNERGTAERQVGGWSAGSLMGAGPARPEGAMGEGATQPSAMPPGYNGTANGGPN